MTTLLTKLDAVAVRAGVTICARMLLVAGCGRDRQAEEDPRAASRDVALLRSAVDGPHPAGARAIRHAAGARVAPGARRRDRVSLVRPSAAARRRPAARASWPRPPAGATCRPSSAIACQAGSDVAAGHELQHAVEIADAPEVVDEASSRRCIDASEPTAGAGAFRGIRLVRDTSGDRHRPAGLQRADGTVVRKGTALAPSHRRTLAPSHPRTLAPLAPS